MKVMAYIRKQAGRVKLSTEPSGWSLPRLAGPALSATLCRPGALLARRVPQYQNRCHYRPSRMPWESRVAPAVQPPRRCRHGHGLSTRSSSSLLNPVVRYVVSSTPQTSNESERPTRHDSYRQMRRPNVRGVLDVLSATTNGCE